jgi:ATP phosphoribosyltransferase
LSETIRVALPKGRLGERVYAMFEAAGYGCSDDAGGSRKLFFESADARVRYFWVKPSDTAVYVERGAADVGVAGKDILLEHSPDVYELLDLGVGKCRMAAAAKKNFEDYGPGPLRVATKYANIAREYYSGRGREIDIIKLNGSIELAPIVGLSDVIVDIVETGRTLMENGMEPIQIITDISARLIANKVSYRFKHSDITRLCGRLGSVSIDQNI